MDSVDEPFKLIAGVRLQTIPGFSSADSIDPQGVHHWDENSRIDGDVPKVIKKVHKEEVAFVRAWMDEFDERGRWRPE